jgi:hypothetical protein
MKVQTIGLQYGIDGTTHLNNHTMKTLFKEVIQFFIDIYNEIKSVLPRKLQS